MSKFNAKTQRPKDGQTPLQIAASDGYGYHWYKREADYVATNKDILTLLLAHGADPNHIGERTSLYHAVISLNVDAVELLLPVTEKKDVAKRDDLTGEIIGTNPWYYPFITIFNTSNLYCDLSKKICQIMRLLKEHGADLNFDNGLLLYRVLTAFTWIKSPTSRFQCEYKSECESAQRHFNKTFEALEFLLENGVDPSVFTRPDDMSPLHFFIKETNLIFIEGATEKVLNILIHKGVEVNKADSKRNTPLHVACSLNDVPAVRCLLSHGADRNAINAEGKTPEQLMLLGRDTNTIINLLKELRI